MYGYIYLTEHIATGKVYVGQRKGGFDPEYTGSGKLIKLAVAKHGPSEFKVFFLQAAQDRAHADELERIYIREQRELRPSSMIFNIADGGQGGNIWTPPPGWVNPQIGRKFSDERRRNISQAVMGCGGPNHGNRGKIRSPETRTKVSDAKKGQVSRSGWKMTDEQKRKISETRMTRLAAGLIKPNIVVHSDEAKMIMSQKKKAYLAEHPIIYTPERLKKMSDSMKRTLAIKRGRITS